MLHIIHNTFLFCCPAYTLPDFLLQKVSMNKQHHCCSEWQVRCGSCGIIPAFPLRDWGELQITSSGWWTLRYDGVLNISSTVFCFIAHKHCNADYCTKCFVSLNKITCFNREKRSSGWKQRNETRSRIPWYRNVVTESLTSKLGNWRRWITQLLVDDRCVLYWMLCNCNVFSAFSVVVRCRCKREWVW